MPPKKRLNIIDGSVDKPIDEEFYPVIDTDLGRDNLENDLPYADRLDHR